MWITACIIIIVTFLRDTNANIPKIAVYWTAPTGSFFTHFSSHLLIPEAYQGSPGTVSIITGLTNSNSVEMVMSYISGDGSSRGWYAHEEIDFYDQYAHICYNTTGRWKYSKYRHSRYNGKLNHTILTLGGNNSVPVNSTVTAEFDFKGGITNITTGPSQYQVGLSFDQSAASSGSGNWQTSPGIDFSQIVMGIETTGNATWNWGPTVWSDVTMTANTPDPAWCTSNSNMIGGEGREYNFQTSVNGNSSTCIVEIVELDIPWTPYPY